MTEPTTVTLINAANWREKLPQLAALLKGAVANGLTTISDPAGAQPDPEGLATIIDPAYWSAHQSELAEILAEGSNASGAATLGSASGAAPASPERLTLTVEEAASLLGISRAFAYESVHRGDIPSIRLGRRILIPRAALVKLADGA
jgi:excisionase family DNA binding protein